VGKLSYAGREKENPNFENKTRKSLWFYISYILTLSPKAFELMPAMKLFAEDLIRGFALRRDILNEKFACLACFG
jgi:hypothetical protein